MLKKYQEMCNFAKYEIIFSENSAVLTLAAPLVSCLIAGMGKLQSVGQMRPVKIFNPAHCT